MFPICINASRNKQTTNGCEIDLRRLNVINIKRLYSFVKNKRERERKKANYQKNISHLGIHVVASVKKQIKNQRKKKKLKREREQNVIEYFKY